MSLQQQKHQRFVSEPMGYKSVTALPGIGDKLGETLDAAGFDKAYAVFGQYLVLKKDKKRFIEWMKKYEPDAQNSENCYQALFEWCEKFWDKEEGAKRESQAPPTHVNLHLSFGGNFEAMDCSMSLKVHILHADLDKFGNNTEAYWEEHAERFHRDIMDF